MSAIVHHDPVTARDASGARERLAGSGVVRTPLLRLNLDDPHREIYLKLENLQPIGSFKIRGMWNALVSADERSLGRGVWTLSAGNAAQGLAWSASRLGVACTVVVPDNAPRAKLDAVEGLGAKIVAVPVEEWFGFAATRTFPGLEAFLVHPFSDRAVMAGNGTIALEILEDLPDVDTVLVPWGGGGLCCGIAAVLRDVAPTVRV
jgi:threonine dehydratase